MNRGIALMTGHDRIAAERDLFGEISADLADYGDWESNTILNAAIHLNLEEPTEYVSSTAYCEGWAEHLAGTPSHDNPYSALRQHENHAEWARGWANRDECVEESSVLDDDDDEEDES